MDDTTKLYDLKGFQDKKDLFKGEPLRKRPSTVIKQETVAQDTNVTHAIITTESTSSYIKLEDNDNISKKINADDFPDDNDSFVNETLQVTLPEIVDQIVLNTNKKYDPQEMLERFRKEDKFPRNSTWEENFGVMQCKAQPFLQKLSICGEFFNK